ncbi:MAG: GTP 3',8-cyclase MoaA [Acidobacteriota bacterium]
MRYFKKDFLRDFSGAFGDTGTFIPLALGMIIICGLSPTSVFLPAGVLYVIAGLYYKIPMPVQPLKAVAAISIVNGIKPEIISTSAYIMAALMAIFLIFDFSKYLEKIFSKPLVRGIQFGLGILLIKSGIELVFKKEIITGVLLPDVKFSGFSLGPNPLSFFFPAFDNLLTAFVILIIPQIPLTLGNSIVATSDLAKDYFGDRAKKVNHNSLAKTIGFGNFFAGMLSGMPLCHGCGGLTAHYRFGARTGRANLIIGFTFIIVALFFARMSSYFLRGIPLYVFGIALVFIGIFHSLLARDLNKGKDIFIVMIMGLITLFYKNFTLALFSGLALREALNYKVYWEKLNNFKVSIFNRKNKSEAFKYNGSHKEERVETTRHLFDRYNRAITYLRISLTENCNLKCLYCMPKQDSVKALKKDFLTNSEIYRMAKIAVSLGIEKIRLTGGEPLLREGIIELIEKISSIDNLKDLSLSTNGTLLEKYADSLRKAGLKRINISLDTLDEKKFEIITRGKKLGSVLNGIRKAKLAGLKPIKINVVVLKGINDDELENFIKFGKEYDLIVRFIEYMPIVLNEKWKKYFISREEIIQRISSFLDFRAYPYENSGDPSRYFYLESGGEAGIISPVSHGFCHNCNRLRLTADGFLRSCLTHDIEIDVKTPLRENAGDETISELFKKAVLLKPEKGIYNLREETIRRNMSQIGG